MTGLKVLDAKTHEQRTIPAQGIFLAIGHEPNTRLFKDFIELEETTGTIKLPRDSKQTSLEGVFAAGDVERRRRQACVAAGSGAEAALDAKEFLDGLGFTKQAAAKLRLFKPDMTGVDADVLVAPAADGSVKELFSLADFTREVQEKKGLVCVNVLDAKSPAQEVVRDVAQDFAGTVAFVTVDKDKAADIANRFFVEQTPCRLVFSNGSLVARNQKDMDAQTLREFVGSIAQEAATAA